MKKTGFFWMLAGILTFCCTMTMLTSCSDDELDVPEENPIIPQLLGEWYVAYDQQGTLPALSDYSSERVYTQKVLYLIFNEGGKGQWVEYLMDEMGNPLASYGGLDASIAEGSVIYSPLNDGSLIIATPNYNDSGAATLPHSLKLVDGKLVGMDGSSEINLQPATEEQKNKVHQWDNIFNGGGNGGIYMDPNYNINNDATIMHDDVFTKDNWLTHQQIIIRTTGEYVDDQIRDAGGRKGYRSITLPWAKGEDGQDVIMQSQLPAGFCDDLNPDNGWSMVANYCGLYNSVGANYIAFYNKWLGTLRYFYYIPDEAKLNGAVDHNWEIQMYEGAAEHTPFRYAAPMDKKVLHPEYIDAMHDGFWSQFVTPWTSSQNSLGQLEPKAGWYAFDVDLSVYRDPATAASMEKDRFIKPVIRGYKTSNVELYGNINADITGDVKLQKSCVNTSNGVFGPMEDVFEQIGDVKKFITNAQKVWKELSGGDIFEAIEGGVGLAKQGCDLVGIDYGKKKEGFDGYKGTVNLKLSGTIDMKGKIKENNVIQGPSDITMPMNTFDFENTLLGEGVWNLVTSPVVYYTNAQFSWREEYAYASNIGVSNKMNDILWVDGKSPFQGTKKTEYVGEIGSKRQTVTTSDKPWCGYVAYFDPSTIKVELNPNLFTEAERNSIKVYATCGVRKANSAFGSVDGFRKAMELKDSKLEIDMNNGQRYVNRPTSEAPFDAMSNVAEKLGLNTGAKFTATKYDTHNCGMFGLGDDSFILQPQPLSGDDHALMTYMPSYEVTVTVMVEHDGKPIVYSRTYLPEYVKVDVADIPYLTEKQISEKTPDNYVPAIYAQQIGHINDIYLWSRRTLSAVAGTPLHYKSTQTTSGEGFDDYYLAWPRFIDGNANNMWRSTYAARTKSSVKDSKTECLYARFSTNFGVSPTSYTLVTSNDYVANKGKNRPRTWSLYGKKNESDKWTLLDERDVKEGSADLLPVANLTAKTYKFNKANPQDFKYFAFEVYDIMDYSVDSDKTPLELGEFIFNYD